MSPSPATGPVAAIVGMGDAYASRDNRKDPMRLAVEAARAALKDAGIGRQQVDAVFTGRSPWADKRSQWSNIFISHMQMPVTINSELTMHGAGLTASFGEVVPVQVFTVISSSGRCVPEAHPQ